MIVPTRVGLKSGDTICLFTIDLDFLLNPSVGNFVVFDVSTGDIKTVETKVTHICHYFPNDDAAVILDYIECDKYDDMLLILDWFKYKYELRDIVSESDPQSYYILHRLILQLLGRSKEPQSLLNIDTDSVKIFAEACRAVIIAQFYNGDEYESIHIHNTNQAVVDLHSLILAEKKCAMNGYIKIINVIKIWESLLNKNGIIKWDVDIKECKRVARFVFGRLRSIPANLLPDFGDA